MLTLGDARNSSIVNIAGVVPTSDRFSDYVNEAVRRLLRRGDFKGTIVPIQVCVGMGCVTWPRIVGSVRKVHTCRGGIKVKNQWYQFLEYKHNHRFWRDLRDWECTMAAIGEVSTYNDMPPGGGWAIRVYVDRKEDVGQSVTIFGIDDNGQRIQTQNTDGSWSDGMQLVAIAPWSQTTFGVRTLERTVKTVTQGPMRIYAVNQSNDSMLDLAVYGPTETTPAYERYNITRGNLTNCCCSPTSVGSVVALVKLRYIPAVADTDLLAIDNLDGLKMEVMAIKREEAGDDAGYRIKEQDAVHECNRDMENAYPDEQTTTRYETFANTWVGGQQCY